jgi:hypothetical protein
LMDMTFSAMPLVDGVMPKMTNLMKMKNEATLKLEGLEMRN